MSETSGPAMPALLSPDATTLAATHHAAGRVHVRSDGGKPSVLFVCVHNAGRSQMAAGFLRHLAGDAIEVRSAGSAPAEQINPTAVEAMKEIGIDITGQKPQVLTPEDSQASSVVITMGCGDVCPYYPGQRHEDWDIPDPAGQDLDTVRTIRDDIGQRVRALVDDLTR